MPAIAFAIPILPGKEALDRDAMDEMAGARRDDYEAALRDAGVTRHTVWHQETPDGTIEQKLGHDPSSGSWNEPDYRGQSTRRRPARPPRYRFRHRAAVKADP